MLLVGCGAKETVENKVAEKIFEQSTGGKLDIDGDTMTFKGEDGEELVFGENKWPTTALAKMVPEFKNATVNAVLSSPDSVTISLEKVRAADVPAYMESVKKLFPKDVFEMKSDDLLTISGKNKAGTSVSVLYSNETMTVSLASEGAQ